MLSLTATELPRFMACNGSRLMGAIAPFDQDDTVTQQGNAVHWMIEQVFKGIITAEELVDRKAPNGIFITGEMLDDATAYLSDILGRGSVEVDTSYGNGWSVRGRADHIYFDGYTLYVRDFKYGWRIVEAEENWTLISHALGFISQNPQLAVQEVVFSIYQPRSFHPEGTERHWKISRAELDVFFGKLMYALANPTDTLQTSSHCYRCPALALCPAAQIATSNALEVGTLAFNSEMSNEAAVKLLEQSERALEMLKQFQNACEDLIKHRLKEGQRIKDYALQTAYGHSAWLEGLTPEVVQAMTGADLTKKSLVTPAEAKRRGVPEDVVKSLTVRPVNGVKLSKISEHKLAENYLGKKGK